MPRKVECVFCHKKFHPKGIFSHQARCNERFIKTQEQPANTVAAQPILYSWQDMQHQRELGRKEGAEQYKQKFSDVQIKAVEAAAKAVDALAHMIGELR